MTPVERHVGERLSFKRQACTVRYVGPVADKPGKWLGVEWDNPRRGKHNGTHEGVAHFTCRSKSSTCASFLRPDQPWDAPRTFLQALREKYMPEFHDSDAEIVYFSGKQAEEVGFEKFSKRQAKLQGIRVLVLDHMCIKHLSPSSEDSPETSSIRDLCVNVTDLDLSGNLFESWNEIVDLCMHLPSLTTLTLDGNRFSIEESKSRMDLAFIRSLTLSGTLLSVPEVSDVASWCGALQSLTIANNGIQSIGALRLPTSVHTLDLSGNEIDSLACLVPDHPFGPQLRSLILKMNSISASDMKAVIDFPGVEELDISHNAVEDWSVLEDVQRRLYPSIKHLRVTGNPIYSTLTSVSGQRLSAEDGYMLTIARMAGLETLNYSKITDKERLNAETYYLAQIAAELSNAPRSGEDRILNMHPRYRALCEEYGVPDIQGKRAADEIDPNSLAAKLVVVTFTTAPQVPMLAKPRSWTEEIPKSFNIYSILGIVGKQLGVMPLSLRLVLETEEQDPVGRSREYEGPESWDSSDDEMEDEKLEWRLREVELVPGTRVLGTYVEAREAKVRVEVRNVG